MHWRKKWQPTPVFLPGESQGRGSLVGCGPWGCKESDMTEQLTHTHTITPSMLSEPITLKSLRKLKLKLHKNKKIKHDYLRVVIIAVTVINNYIVPFLLYPHNFISFGPHSSTL